LNRVRDIYPLFRTTLLSLVFLLPSYFIVSEFHGRAERQQREVLRQWARADFDLLSLSRALRILPLSAFLVQRPLTPVEVRLVRGWIIQGQVTLQDLEKSRPLFSRVQRDALKQLEENFRFLKDFLLVSTKSSSPSTISGKQEPLSSFFAIWSLDRKLGMSMAVLSLSVRTSLGDAERGLARLETMWERIYWGLLFGFLVVLLGVEGWKLKKTTGDIFTKEAQLQAVFNAMQDAVVYTDRERRVRFANPAVEDVFGYRSSDLVGQSAAVFYMRPEDFDRQGQLRYHPDARDLSEPYEMEYRRKDGRPFTGEARGAVVRDPAGRVQGFMVTVRDISQRKEMMDRLFLEKEKWFVTLGSIGDAVIVTDVGARVEYLNSVAEELTGWGHTEAIGRPVQDVFDIVNELTRTPAENPVAKSLRLGTIVGLANHTVLRKRSGEEYSIEDSAAPIRNRDGQVIGCVIVFRDVTQKRRLERQIAYQANHDALTGLPNRHLFQDRLSQTIARSHRSGRPFALLYLDIDHFKNVNDRLGHPFGDRVLVELGQRLKGVVRESDTVARLGGDEFAVILGDLKEQTEALILGRRLMQEASLPFRFDDARVDLTISVGVALYPEDGVDATLLVRNADIALFHVKGDGRNNVQFFSEEMNRIVQGRLEIENGLRDALDREEFFLLYQPIVDLDQGKAVGVEALLRWRHGEEVRLPERFIPVAEDRGLIVPIGRWILEKAVRQTRLWLDRGFSPSRVTVNLAAKQIHSADFVEFLETLLRDNRVESSLLELEVTEGTLLFQDNHTLETLSKIRELGVRISIDDFGTGYSSLNYLRHFPVNTLKIDRSFLNEIPDNHYDQAIVRAILALARSLSLDVVAEGIEREEQARFLRDNGCFLAQGYLYSHPVPPDEIPPFFGRIDPRSGPVIPD
jgi:diguanylate cyclase (GGDEF)-like protein/PAS domain S-box-containing protein